MGRIDSDTPTSRLERELTRLGDAIRGNTVSSWFLAGSLGVALGICLGFWFGRWTFEKEAVANGVLHRIDRNDGGSSYRWVNNKSY